MNRWINKRCNVAAVVLACFFLNDQYNPTQIVGLHMVKLNQWQSQWHLQWVKKTTGREEIKKKKKKPFNEHYRLKQIGPTTYGAHKWDAAGPLCQEENWNQKKKRAKKVSFEVTGVIKHHQTALPLHAFYTY